MKELNELLNLIENSREKDKEINGDWKKIKDLSNEKTEIFKWNTYLNENDKEVAIVHLGEKDLFEGIYNFGLWLPIYNQEVPSNLKTDVMKYLAEVEHVIGEREIKDYKIINVGYSTGSIGSDLLALYFKFKGFQSDSITFENPGSKPIIEKFASELGIEELEPLKSGFVAINAKESWMNGINEYFGELIHVDSIYKAESIISSIGYLFFKVGTIVSVAYSAFSLISKVFNSMGWSSYSEAGGNNDFEEGAVKIFSESLTEIGNKVIEFDKAMYAHELARFEQFVNDYTNKYNDLSSDKREEIDSESNESLEMHKEDELVSQQA